MRYKKGCFRSVFDWVTLSVPLVLCSSENVASAEFFQESVIVFLDNRFSLIFAFASVRAGQIDKPESACNELFEKFGTNMHNDQGEIVIGILGGVGPAAGILLHQVLLNHTENEGTDQGHLDVSHVSRSQDTTDRTTYLLKAETLSEKELKEQFENPALGMIRTLSVLASGVESRGAKAVVGVPCNTFHAPLIWNEFKRLADEKMEDRVELVHMLEETVNMIKVMGPNCKKIGLMSTNGTRKSKVYHRLLEPLGYQVIEVEDDMQVKLHDTIYNKSWGIKGTSPAITPRAVSNFHEYAKWIAGKGAEMIILGCTEIPFAFVGVDTIGHAILIDPMVALGRALIRKANIDRLKLLETPCPIVTEKECTLTVSMSLKKTPLFPNRKPRETVRISHHRQLKESENQTTIPHHLRRKQTATLGQLSQRSRPRASSKTLVAFDDTSSSTSSCDEKQPRTWRIFNFYSSYVDSYLNNASH